jgi:hypothetical protein
MRGVTWERRAWTEPSSWPSRSSMSLGGVPASSMIVRWVCRRPCGVRPAAMGTQQAWARLAAPLPRAGMPGQGSARSGTGWGS